jgi:hypothetical protein
MKKFILIILFAQMAQYGTAQTVFEKFQNSDAVSYISINPKMFQLFGKMSINTGDPEAQAYLDMVRSIKNFKVLITGDASIGDEIGEMVNKMVSQEAMETLMTVKDSDANIVFYIKSNDNDSKVERLLMFSKGLKGIDLDVNNANVENVLLLLEGAIDLDQISLLTEKMDLPGGDQLKKAKKKNQ